MSNQLAAELYAERSAEIEDLCHQLVYLTSLDAVDHATLTWGHSGNLGHVVERLREIVDFARGSK